MNKYELALELGLAANVAACSSQPGPKPQHHFETSTQTCGKAKDVSAKDPACNAIRYALRKGFLAVDPFGNFQPDAIMKRGETAEAVLKAFNKFDENTDYCEGQKPFPDVELSNPHAQAICDGKQRGMLTGYKGPPKPGSFGPENDTKRVELLAMVARNLETEKVPVMVTTLSYKDIKTDNPATQWFLPYAALSERDGLFPGPNLMPANPVNKKEVAEVSFKEVGKKH